MAKQELILLFDGTWNDPCVGTSRFQRFISGSFGYGLSKNLREGCDWLSKRYKEGDEIWIFSFSRGAYTARRLVGLIRKCGLVHVVTPELLDRTGNIYRDQDLYPDSEVCKEFKETWRSQ